MHTHVTAHLLRDAARNGQPQPGTAVVACDAAVGLCEGFKHGVQLARGDADAGVGDDKAQPLRRARVGRRRQSDMTGRRELDGVADQVDQRLRQPFGVAMHMGGQLPVTLVMQLQTLGLRAWAHQRHDPVEHLGQRKVCGG